MQVMWLGHSACLVSADGDIALIDPWLSDSPWKVSVPDDIAVVFTALESGPGAALTSGLRVCAARLSTTAELTRLRASRSSVC